MIPKTPRLKAPPGACDTHMHFYDRRFPASSSAWLFPPDFRPEDYLPVRARLGLERMIIVQPVTYGFDNRCTLAGVARFGDCARAIVTVPVSISDAELDSLWQQGARGLRFHQMRGGMMAWDELPVMAERIRDSQWHVQLQLDGLELPQYEALIAGLPCRVVIDHMGRYSRPISPDHPAFQALLRLARLPNIWVKISGAYHISRAQAPDWADVAPLARALCEQSTDRLLWGSDWPHPTEKPPHVPDDADLLDFLLGCTVADSDRVAILSANPARLYGFGDA